MNVCCIVFISHSIEELGDQCNVVFAGLFTMGISREITGRGG
jgi:hypothetical protein